MDLSVPSVELIISEERKSIVDDGIHLNDEEFNISSSSSSNSIQSEDPHSSIEQDFSDDDEEYFQKFVWPETTDDDLDERSTIEDNLTRKQLKIALDLEEKPYRRVKRSNKKIKAQKQCKDKNAKSIRYQSHNQLIYMHHRLFKRVFLDPPSYNYLGSDRPVPIYSPEGLRSLRQKDQNNKTSAHFTSTQVVYPPAPVIPTQLRPFTLTEQTRTQEPAFDDALISLLMDLQNRDLSPEDYELLLRLDERVPRKTVNTSVLDNFPNVIVDENHLGEICSICIENYLLGQKLKRLPCSHLFHSECIERYLKECSVQCPLDNLPLV